QLIDGNYWYEASPPNRWTFEGSPRHVDGLAVELGAKCRIDAVKLYLLEDGPKVAPPTKFEVEYHDGKFYRPVAEEKRTPKPPAGRRANEVRFRPVETDRVRVTFTHRGESRTGLSEVEVWGDAELPVAPPPPPAGNLAYNPGGKPFPKASASYTSRFD